jgi:hypothetical protein
MVARSAARSSAVDDGSVPRARETARPVASSALFRPAVTRSLRCFAKDALLPRTIRWTYDARWWRNGAVVSCRPVLERPTKRPRVPPSLKPLKVKECSWIPICRRRCLATRVPRPTSLASSFIAHGAVTEPWPLPRRIAVQCAEGKCGSWTRGGPSRAWSMT